MTEPQAAAEPLVMRRTFTADREEVFRAWTDPGAIAQWLAPQRHWTVSVAALDLRPGGRYRIGMHDPDQESPYFVTGLYREIAPPELLVFTWRWESWEPSQPDSLVTLELHERQGRTELVLRHELLPDADAASEHAHGWEGCLAGLEGFLA